MPRSALDDVLECMICMDDIDNAYLCPECSKMACRKCWDGVIFSAGSCPCCRCKLNQSNLIKCRWIDDVGLCVKQLLNESDQTECDKARVNEMEESLISVRSLLDEERKVFEDEKNEFLQEKEVFKIELESFAEEQKAEQIKAQKNVEKSESLAVEKAIYNEKQDMLNNDIQIFVDMQKRAEIGDGSAIGVISDVNFYLKKVLDNTQKLPCSVLDHEDELVACFNEMKTTLSALTEKLVDCKETLLANPGGPHAA